jgi:hypothetical protein
VTIPDEILLALKLDPATGEREIRLVVDVGLYELYELSRLTVA